MRDQVIIFSVYQGDSALNIQNHFETKNFLQSSGVSFKEVAGKYKGQSELSLVVNAKHEFIVETLANKFNQESYLFIDRKRNAYLTYLSTDKTEKIGQFVKVNKNEDVSQLENQTIDGQSIYKVV